MEELTKKELLDYLEEISQQLNNIALDQIPFAISELYFKLENSVPISLIKKRIEILDMRIEYTRKELEKSCKERETLGTETDIDNNEAYIFHIEEELNHRCAEKNALRKLLDERNNTDE